VRSSNSCLPSPGEKPQKESRQTANSSSSSSNSRPHLWLCCGLGLDLAAFKVALLDGKPRGLHSSIDGNPSMGRTREHFPERRPWKTTVEATNSNAIG